MEEKNEVVQKMSLGQAWDLVRAIPGAKAAADVLEPIIRKDVLAIGTDQVFAMRDKSGEIRCFKQRLHLSAADGTLIQPVFNGPFVVSAQGYERWLEATGTFCGFPPTLMVGGKAVPNPYVVTDERNGRIKMIYARAVAFRFSPKGHQISSDWTTVYDVPSYRMIDLIAKAKKFPQAFRLLPIDMKPDADGTWSKYAFDEASSLWVNTSHGEALDWFGQILNREKKAMDFAQTFAKRNCLKHLSGIQKAPGQAWDIEAYSWRYVNGAPMGGSLETFDALQTALLQIAMAGNMDNEVIKGIEHVSTDETAGAVLAEEEEVEPAIDVQPEMKTVKIEPAPAPTKQTKPTGGTGNVHPAIRNMEVAREQFPDEFSAALKNLNISEDADILVPEATKICKEINRILDTAAAGGAK